MPQPDNVIRLCPLAGGLQGVVADRTSHYFGGYYHVRVQVSADVPVEASAFTDPAEYRDAVGRLGGSVRFSRILEKMAVPESELEAVRRQLLESFDENVLPYLQRDDFPGSFVRSEYRKALQRNTALFR